MDLYREQLLDHYHHPRHQGVLANATHQQRGLNPLCGDEVHVYVQIANQQVEGMSFTGHGCVISQAAASLLTEAVIGKTLVEIKQFDRSVVEAWLGIAVPPSRLSCALLALDALHLAISRKAA